jgi:hypothetical protein
MSPKSEVVRFKISFLIKEGKKRYRLLIVERRDFDVYCFIPHLGTHYSFHNSGKIYFRPEGKIVQPEDQPPVILMPGQAGRPIYSSQQKSSLPIGWQCNSIRDLGRAEGIFTAIFAGIELLNQSYQEFKRNTKDYFLIDKDLLPQNTYAIQIGVWAIPTRNPASFHYEHPNIPAHLLYKVEQYEPQIWIYAEPLSEQAN